LSAAHFSLFLLFWEMKEMGSGVFEKRENGRRGYRYMHFIITNAMKRFLMLLILTTLMLDGAAQKVVSGKSSPTKISIQPEYKRGLPPFLYADFEFSDENDNRIIEANEKATLSILITNKGKGPAQNLAVSVTDDKPDRNFAIGKTGTIPFLMPEQSTKVVIPLEAGMEVSSEEHKLEINIREHFGYDLDPGYLKITTMKYREPQLALSGVEVIDIGEGTAAIRTDGKIQAGEQVKVRVKVQNVGQNVSHHTRFAIKCRDQNIYLKDSDGNLGDLGIGEVKDFSFTISPNKRVINTGSLPLFITLTNEVKRGELAETSLGLALDQKPDEPVVLNVQPDYGKLEKQVARFEFSSDRMTANVGNIIDVKQAPPSRMIRADAVAIVIGVEHYDNFVAAPYAENDATLITSYFKSVLGISKVYTYRSKDVTGFFFENKFNPAYGELQKAIVKGQTDLFVFYSGHGIPSKDGNNAYLLPADGRIEAIDYQGYDLDKFYKNLESLGARSVTVFIDACFSGASRSSELYKPENLVAMKGGVKILPKVTKPWEANNYFTVFASSGFDETSLAFDPSETGLFTYYLCAGLQGKADADGDKTITAGELGRYINTNVRESSVKIMGIQTPQFHGDEKLVLTEY